MNCILEHLIEVAEIVKADEMKSTLNIVCDTCKGRNFLIKMESSKYCESRWYEMQKSVKKSRTDICQVDNNKKK